jgi:hypothetical protein
MYILRKSQGIRMYKTFGGLFFVFLSCSGNTLSAAKFSFVGLPEVAQGADVHTLSKTYCKALWMGVRTAGCPGYLSAASPDFKDVFGESVLELGSVIEKVKNALPIVSEASVADLGAYFDSAAYPSLKMALTSMSVLGKHKGVSDFDPEANARVNEVFVYSWSRVKEDPTKLQAFFVGLVDAASTCIQGYTVRMLCAVHPPRLRSIAKR